MALTGCSTDVTGRTDPGGLTHRAFERVATDRLLETTLTVHGTVTDFPTPNGYDGDAQVLVLVDVTLSAGDVLQATTGPSDLALRAAAGDERAAETSPAVSVALTDATLWPLEDLPGGRSQRGWVAFPVDRDTLDRAELVLRLPAHDRNSDDSPRDELVVLLAED
ncbi:hypothetical protein [Sanguibacter suaedae]|nr:hypothetical protein [Sanguibacter suaedae]